MNRLALRVPFSLVFKPKIPHLILWSVMDRDELFEGKDKKRYGRVFKKGVKRRGNRIIRL